MKFATLVGLGTACMLSNIAAYAHHAFATEFDVNRQVTLEGKVTKVELINPHSWIHIEVIQDGKPVTWMVEGGSPNALVRRGNGRGMHQRDTCRTVDCRLKLRSFCENRSRMPVISLLDGEGASRCHRTA